MPETHQGRYNEFIALKAYAPTRGIALEAQYCGAICPDGRPALTPRAVRVDLRTGAVVAVLAYDAPSRWIKSVLGGSDGVVYVTWKGLPKGPTWTYLRFPGDRYGRQVTGLRGLVLAAQP